MKELFEELKELTSKHRNGTNYFSYSHKRKKFVFRFQNIYIKQPNGWMQTAYFLGDDPEKVLRKAVTWFKEYSIDRNKTTKTDVIETNTN